MKKAYCLSPFTVTEFPQPELFECGVLSLDTVVNPETGIPINIYTNQHGEGLPYVIFANGLGVQGVFAEPLARQFQGYANFVSWDLRCLPGPGTCDFSTIGVEDHAGDMLFVLDYLDVKEAMAIGYCVGAEIALYASLLNPAKFSGIFLLNGAFSLKAPTLTKEEKITEDMFFSLARDPSIVELYFKLMQPRAEKELDIGYNDKEKKMLDIIKYPYRIDSEKLYRISVMATNIINNNIEEWIGRVDTPCITFLDPDDEISHYKQTEQISSLIKHCHIGEFPCPNEKLGHYAIYMNERLQTYIRDRCLTQLRADVSV